MAAPIHIASLGTEPVGYETAFRAAQLCARFTAVEREKLGRMCLNRGCIQSQALIFYVELGVSATVVQVAAMIHAHPTLAEGMMKAMDDIGRLRYPSNSEEGQ